MVIIIIAIIYSIVNCRLIVFNSWLIAIIIISRLIVIIIISKLVIHILWLIIILWDHCPLNFQLYITVKWRHRFCVMSLWVFPMSIIALTTTCSRQLTFNDSALLTQFVRSCVETCRLVNRHRWPRNPWRIKYNNDHDNVGHEGATSFSQFSCTLHGNGYVKTSYCTHSAAVAVGRQKLVL